MGSYNELKALELTWVAVDKMNASGGGTPAQQYTLAMAWREGFHFAHGDESEELAEDELNVWKEFPGTLACIERFKYYTIGEKYGIFDEPDYDDEY